MSISTLSPAWLSTISASEQPPTGENVVTLCELQANNRLAGGLQLLEESPQLWSLRNAPLALLLSLAPFKFSDLHLLLKSLLHMFLTLTIVPEQEK